MEPTDWPSRVHLTTLLCDGCSTGRWVLPIRVPWRGPMVPLLEHVYPYWPVAMPPTGFYRADSCRLGLRRRHPVQRKRGRRLMAGYASPNCSMRTAG